MNERTENDGHAIARTSRRAVPRCMNPAWLASYQVDKDETRSISTTNETFISSISTTQKQARDTIHAG